jgi:hypothetical protein
MPALPLPKRERARDEEEKKTLKSGVPVQSDIMPLDECKLLLNEERLREKYDRRDTH